MTTKQTTSDAKHPRIVHNPYADVDWNRVDHCLSQFHIHEPRNRINPQSVAHDPPADATGGEDDARSTPGALVDKYQLAGYGALAVTEHEYFINGVKRKGEPFAEEFDVTTWPWSRWERDGDPDGLIPIQGAELRGTIDGVDGRHDIVSLGNDLGHGRGRSLEEVAAEVGKRGGVSFLPHPGKYVEPTLDSLHAYIELFEQSDSLLGIEAFNANDRFPTCRAIWDALLTEFGTRRPIWAFANDDYHAKQRPRGDERFDQSRTVLLLDAQSSEDVLDALRTGRSYVQYNNGGSAPMIESIVAGEHSVRIASPSATEVRWIAEGEVVSTAFEFAFAECPAGYVRAEVSAADGAVSCTQPIYLRGE
jgi:hypothetical protein